MKLLNFAILFVVSALLGTPSVTTTTNLSAPDATGLFVDGTLIEHPTDPVIETTPTTDAEDRRISELVEQSQSEISAQSEQSDPAATPELPIDRAGSASAGGGISVVFNTSSPSPASVQAVIRAAVDQWDAALVTTAGGPVEVEVFWSSLGSTSLLGYAGPDGMFSGSSLPTSDRYTAALTNSLLGVDANGPARPEVQVVLNSDLASSGRWHISTTGTPAPGQLDLFTVALHEVGHGLGFLGSAESDDSGIVSLAPTPFTFDQQARYQNAAIPSLTFPQTALTSRNLKIEVSDVETFQLYAPSNWQEGSSYSHFDESSYPAGQPGALMTPTVRNTEVARTIDAPTLGVMQQVGWEIVPKAVTPTITASSVTTSSVTLNWDRNLDSSGLPPSSYQVAALRNGTSVVKTVTVIGFETSVTINGLAAGTDYTIRVTPVGANGSGSAATESVTLSGSPPTTAGPDTTTTTKPDTTTTSPTTTKPDTTTTKPTTTKPDTTTTKPTTTKPDTTTTDTGPDVANVRDVALDGQIDRLYQAYFLRQADQNGFEYWRSQRAQGISLEQISGAFSTSQEFRSRYGSLTNSQFVSLVYRNVLARTPDARGLAYWRQALANGQSRESIMVGFAESSEFVARTGTAAAHSSNEGSIRRLYQAFFLRSPDAKGLSYWVDQLNSGRSLADIANEFSTSSEFVNRYGSLSNRNFVELVYRNVLGRTPDANGLSYWQRQLNNGQSRGTVMTGLSESSEFIVKTGTIP